MSIDFIKLINKKKPEYDIDRYYPREDEVWTLRDNQTKVFIIGISQTKEIKRDCIVIKSGFFYKKGQVIEVPINDFPYVPLKDGYESEKIEPNTNGKLIFEPGDIIDLKKYDIASMGIVIPDDVKDFYTIVGVGIDQIFLIPKEYESYRVWTADDQRREKLEQEQRSNRMQAKIIPFRR